MDTLTAPLNYEQTIRNSRFLASAVALDNCATTADAITHLSRQDASHNCWAWRYDSVIRSSDDGEPAGSAGRPILAAVDGAALDRILVVVARYFGGTKLGVGGLIRAYGGCAARCLEQAVRVPIIVFGEVELDVGFAEIGIVHTLAERFAAQLRSEQFHPEGVRVALKVPQPALAELRREIINATRGNARFVSPTLENQESGPK